MVCMVGIAGTLLASEAADVLPKVMRVKASLRLEIVVCSILPTSVPDQATSSSPRPRAYSRAGSKDLTVWHPS